MTDQTFTQTFVIERALLTRPMVRRVFARFPNTSLCKMTMTKPDAEEQVFAERVTFAAHAGEFTAIRDAFEALGATVTTPHERNACNERFSRGVDWGNR